MSRLSFHYYGSFGDLFDIASFLASSISRHRIKLIASNVHLDLLRVFLGPTVIDRQVRFIDQDTSQIIRDRILIRKIKPTLYLRMPHSCLLHDYPDIHNPFIIRKINKRQAYSSIFKSPSLLTPSLPHYLSPSDRHHIDRITSSLNSNSKSILFFPHNNTHQPLPLDAISFLCSSLASTGCLIYFSNSGLSSTELSFYSSLGTVIDTPGHLMPFIQSRFTCISGVMGGAIGIAIDFTNCHVCSIVTPNKHYPEDIVFPLDDDWRSIMNYNHFPHTQSRKIEVTNCTQSPYYSESINTYIAQVISICS